MLNRLRTFVVVLSMSAMAIGVPAASAQATAAKPAPKPPAASVPSVPKSTPAQPPMVKPPKAAAITPVDINRATNEELEAVPGIGKVYAAKIIGGRPYANKAQLVQKKILTQAVYNKIKDHLIAKQ